LLRAKDFRPDIVLLDIGLPDMDGYEVARRLRATPDFADTMLIAHSGYAGEEHFERARQAGFDHHLVKPASITQLNELIVESGNTRNRLGSVS
jgi:two-component system CheB/CheR fusion protein